MDFYLSCCWGDSCTTRRERKREKEIGEKSRLTLLRGEVCVALLSVYGLLPRSSLNAVIHEAQCVTCILTHLTGVGIDESEPRDAGLELSFFRCNGSWEPDRIIVTGQLIVFGARGL